MKTLKTTQKQAAQVYFPVHEYYELKNSARMLNISLAEFLRRGAKKYQQSVASKQKTVTSFNVKNLPTFSWGDDYPENLAQDHDRYLYELSA